MTYAARETTAQFRLHIRCENCLRESTKDISVPDEDEAPADVDELLESSYLANTPYFCRHCEGVIGVLFAVTKARPDARA